MPSGTYKRTKEHALKIKVGLKKHNQFGKNNPVWKGDKVGYVGLHDWVKTQLIKTVNCQLCGTWKGKLDLANKTGKYNRDLDNWFWICRSCHRKYDKRPSPMQGRKLTTSHRRKISDAITQWWASRKTHSNT